MVWRLLERFGFFRLKSDDRWKVHRIGSFEEYKARCGRIIRLRKEVPEDVRRRFEVIDRIVQLSYFDWRLPDVAVNQALFTVEMALKFRYKDITGNEAPNGMAKLLDWAIKTGLCEDRESTVMALKDIRNSSAHPKEDSFIGSFAFPLLPVLVQFINELYDDVDLRKERQKIQLDMNSCLAHFERDGSILTINGCRTIVFIATLLFVENRSGKITYYAAFSNIFDPSSDVEGRIHSDPTKILRCSQIAVQNGYVEFHALGGMIVKLEMIKDDINRNKFESFRAGLSQSVDAKAQELFIRHEMGREAKKLRALDRDSFADNG